MPVGEVVCNAHNQIQTNIHTALPPKNGAKKSKNKSKVKDPKKLKVKDPELQRLSNEAHLADWILVVSSLLQWHQWMKQSTISKAQVTKSHCAVQWLMRQMASVSPSEWNGQ
ncbi:hypothetical protein MHU86_3201 [Fragilaria crotonensis]|nr:hypothetical protein MHU86_3201 [Fragilaria crotonensis]